MKFLKIAGFIVGTPIVLIVLTYFYYRIFHSYTYRYRITVEVEADGKIQSGSGIFETRWQYNPEWFYRVRDWDAGGTGEAPVVDLGTHGILIAVNGALVEYDKCASPPRPIPFAPVFAVSKTEPGGIPPIYNVDKKTLFAALKAFRDRYQLQPFELPQFVWLPNRNDRLSARIVCPENVTNDIDPTIKLGIVTVEMTSDYPDGAIYEKLPWLKSRISDENTSPILTMRRASRFELMSQDLLGDR